MNNLKQIEYWGNHEYDLDTDTLYFNRDYGLCSNFSVLTLFLIALKHHWNLIPQNIVTNLFCYKNINLFKNLITINKNKIIEFKEFSNEICKSFTLNTGINLWGIGHNKNQINLELINLVFDTFFNLTDTVKSNSLRIVDKYKFNKESFNFLLWRKTDKIHEITWFDKDAKYPELSDALNLFKNDFKNVVAQTDDICIKSELSRISDITILNELPLCPDTSGQNGVHTYFNNLTPEQLKNEYNQTHEEQVLNLLSILHLASISKVLVGYPGNMTFTACCLRKNFDNVYFFKDSKNFF